MPRMKCLESEKGERRMEGKQVLCASICTLQDACSEGILAGFIHLPSFSSNTNK